MKGKASSDFGSNSGLMRDAAAAWRRQEGRGGARGRRNPSGGSGGLAVRANPGGMSPMAMVGIGIGAAYVLKIEPVKSMIDQVVGQFKHLGGTPTA
jgi:hypothetical protein